MAEAPFGSLATAVEQAAKALATDPSRAERQAEAILRRAPGDPRALLILGAARRRRGDPTAARTVLAPLAKAHPRATHTHYELALALRDLGEVAPAIAALRHAVALNRNMPEAWRALGDQLFLEGDVRAAENAYADYLRNERTK